MIYEFAGNPEGFKCPEIEAKNEAEAVEKYWDLLRAFREAQNEPA